MTLDYSTCPHCGCRCEDDEYCAACGKLFNDDAISRPKESLLGALGRDLRGKAKKLKVVSHPIDFGGDACLDPEYSSIPGNVAYNLYNDEK